jgi:putative transposase
MRAWYSQAHIKHYCRYHVVFVAKYRRRSIYGTLRKDIEGILQELCRQQGVILI